MNAADQKSLSAIDQLLADFSLEMTGKDASGLSAAAEVLPPRTRVNVTYLAGEQMSTRVDAAAQVTRLGLRPVPHISARRLASAQALDQFLAQLQGAGASASVFAVAGDPPVPEGPFEDTLALIRSGALERFGVTDVSVGGYPEGHPGIPDEVLWKVLTDKENALAERGLAATVITQFAFDAEAVLRWVAQVRQRGVQMPIRIGVPGPAGVKRLLGYAKRFGVGSSTAIARKYGLSLTNLMSTAGPDHFLNALAEGYEPLNHGVVKLHFYTFGGLSTTATWVNRFAEQRLAEARAQAAAAGVAGAAGAAGATWDTENQTFNGRL